MNIVYILVGIAFLFLGFLAWALTAIGKQSDKQSEAFREQWMKEQNGEHGEYDTLNNG